MEETTWIFLIFGLSSMGAALASKLEVIWIIVWVGIQILILLLSVKSICQIAAKKKNMPRILPQTGINKTSFCFVCFPYLCDDGSFLL